MWLVWPLLANNHPAAQASAISNTHVAAAAPPLSTSIIYTGQHQGVGSSVYEFPAMGYDSLTVPPVTQVLPSSQLNNGRDMVLLMPIYAPVDDE